MATGLEIFDRLPRDAAGLDPFGSPKTWTGNEGRLAELLPTIARDIAALLSAQADVRKVREAEEVERKVAADKRAEESRLWFAAQKLIADRKAARRAQVDRARAAGKAYDDFLALRRVVACRRPSRSRTSRRAGNR